MFTLRADRFGIRAFFLDILIIVERMVFVVGQMVETSLWPRWKSANEGHNSAFAVFLHLYLRGEAAPATLTAGYALLPLILWHFKPFQNSLCLTVLSTEKRFLQNNILIFNGCETVFKIFKIDISPIVVVSDNVTSTRFKRVSRVIDVLRSGCLPAGSPSPGMGLASG